MEAIDQTYLTSLQSIKSGIQNSDLLSTYLDTEEEADYTALKEYFEPQISELHTKVAEENPLQLVAFEKELFDEGFEGLYLPRILGYSVLRGEINDRVKYIRPQDHFRDVLNAICNSLNFDILKLRIGQTIQIGFGLSSDIWIANLKGQFSNKKIISFLDAQRMPKYRDVKNRLTGLVKFRKQFESLNYHTTEFPTSANDLKIVAPSLKSFLVYRSLKEFDNSTLNDAIGKFLSDESLRSTDEFIEILMISGLFLDMKVNEGAYKKAINDMRSKEDFAAKYFSIYTKLQDENIGLTPEMDKRLGTLISRNQKDELTEYHQLMDIVHGKGYVHVEATDAVQNYYDRHEGLSVYNECIRGQIMTYFEKFMSNLDEDSYADYFEINKTFVTYMSIFSNQEFNQAVKSLSLKYVRRLKKKYTDKRGKDYQDIKKFVKTTFVDLGFLSEKEIVELFKTKRKPKA